MDTRQYQLAWPWKRKSSLKFHVNFGKKMIDFLLKKGLISELSNRHLYWTIEVRSRNTVTSEEEAGKEERG